MDTTGFFKKSPVYPIVALDNLFPRAARKVIYRELSFTSFILILLIVLAYIGLETSTVPLEYQSLVHLLIPKAFGLALVIVGLWFVFFMLEGFFRSYYFKESECAPSGHGPGSSHQICISFAALKILTDDKASDLTHAFIRSSFGREVLIRAGIPPQSMAEFLSARSISLPNTVVSLFRDDVIGLETLAKFLFSNNPQFRDALFNHGVTEDEFIGATRWVIADEDKEKQNERWWGKEFLRRIPSIGKDWALGSLDFIPFISEITLNESPLDLRVSRILKYKDIVLRLESVLLRRKEANALIIDETGGGISEPLFALLSAVSEGTIAPQLERKRMVRILTDVLITESATKNDVEKNLTDILRALYRAGNVIVVIDNLPQFLRSADHTQADILSVLDYFLSLPNFQIIASSSNSEFTSFIEKQLVLVKRFETIRMNVPNQDELISILRESVSHVEGEEGVFFTYPAVLEIATGVVRYFSEFILQDKAVDIVVELAARSRMSGQFVITEDLVKEIMEEKTGIPIGGATEQEKALLSRLEVELEKRVVGQKHAVTLVAKSLRRARSGVINPKRPMGSFLFLGPTGVGKTETAKALASSFFGGEENLLRLDMTEYSGTDALSRLIGSFENEGTGTLVTLLKDNPYGVLLLDEFEKTHSKVLNLFLQILDEGVFSDVNGKQINARNIIFIATSNAGAELLWEMAKQGKNPSQERDTIIDHLVQKGIYKPELLNRFDATVIFNPLNIETLRQIAVLLLNSFAKRMMGRGIKVEYGNDLVEYVLKNGANAEFGARPMNRFIQEYVEQFVADKLIAGSLNMGDTVTIRAADIQMS